MNEDFSGYERQGSDFKLELVAISYANRGAYFGNGRFVTHLVSTLFIPSMATRSSLMPQKVKTKELLSTITRDDVIATSRKLKAEQKYKYDNQRVMDILSKLDTLIGIEKVKKEIHSFVDTVYRCVGAL